MCLIYIHLMAYTSGTNLKVSVVCIRDGGSVTIVLGVIIHQICHLLFAGWKFKPSDIILPNGETTQHYPIDHILSALYTAVNEQAKEKKKTTLFSHEFKLSKV